MKKIFPVIIVLVTLSLIGTIYVQYNWLRTMLADKQEEFKRTIVKSIDEVGTELMDQRNAVPALKNFRSRPGFRWPSAEFNMELMRPPTISQKFTWYVVEEKLRRSLNNHGLKNINFEFAIISGGNSSPMPGLKSRGFMSEFEKV
ncbi:MAG: sensor histidine kinase, partial [Chitinophagaceae bacterium]